MSWFTRPARKDIFAVLEPVVREKLFSVPSAGDYIVILLNAVGLLHFSLEILGLCAPCSPQEFKVRNHSKTCAEEPVGVRVGVVSMTVRVQHLSTLASWAFHLIIYFRFQ